MGIWVGEKQWGNKKIRNTGNQNIDLSIVNKKKHIDTKSYSKESCLFYCSHCLDRKITKFDEFQERPKVTSNRLIKEAQ